MRGRQSDFAADRAFADIVGRFAIPRCVPDALLEGFCWDTMGREYETLSDVVSYAVRVASTVGVMMTLVMGRRERNVLARAADLGIAMQLTNIARDVGEDARNGRLYLPRQMLLDAGLDPDAWLAEPRFCPEVASVTRQLLAVADQFYARAGAGIENSAAPLQVGHSCSRRHICRDWPRDRAQRSGQCDPARRDVPQAKACLAWSDHHQACTRPVLVQPSYRCLA
jgi:phytoene/squalene synthetase